MFKCLLPFPQRHLIGYHYRNSSILCNMFYCRVNCYEYGVKISNLAMLFNHPIKNQKSQVLEKHHFPIEKP